jgi:hypothetical protein
MVVLEASSRVSNIRRSMNKYMQDKLADTEGHSLDWGQPNFKEEGLEQWIQFRLLFGGGKFQRQVGLSSLGEYVRCFLNFNIFEKYPSRLNIYSLHELRKDIIEWCYQKFIPVYDYETVGSPLAGSIGIQEILNDALIDYGDVNGIRQWNINFLGRYLSKFS